MKKRLAIITTHPIQYNAPLFKELAKYKEIEICVFYTWGEASQKKYDPGFGEEIAWDIPLLEGYNYTFVKNEAKKPGSNHFFGIINPSLIKEINRWGASLTLIYGWCFLSHLKVMFHFKGKIPIYFRGDSTLLNNTNSLKAYIRKSVLSLILNYVDKALYVGTNNKKYYLNHGLKEHQLHFVPHAIDNKRFLTDIFDIQSKEWKKELGINDSDRALLFVGKLEKIKNLVLLLDAFNKLNNSELHLIIVGKGPLEKELKDNYNHPRIHFLGFQNQSKMPLVYRLGDIFVLPSLSETWGLSVNEAMACNLPILVSDKVGCALDLVKYDENGYVFRSNDELDLTEKIELILKKNLILFGNSSKRIIKNWSIQEAALSFIKCL